jgi:S1-C subfamily serine protease
MNRRRGWRSGKAAAYLLMAVLGGFAGAFGARFMDRGAGVVRYSGPVRPYTEVMDAGRPVQLGEPIVQVVRRVGPAGGKFATALGTRDPFRFAPEEERSGEGSGFIINSQDRLAITNNHVVEGRGRSRSPCPISASTPPRSSARTPSALFP